MERKLQQRLVGVLVLAAFVLLIAPVLFDAEGRIPEQITHIPPQPKKPDMSQLSAATSTAAPTAASTVISAATSTATSTAAPTATSTVTSSAASTAEPSSESSVAQQQSTEGDAVSPPADTGSVPVITAAPGSRLWSIQVASFREVGKANALRDRLRAAQFETYVREKLLSDGTIFTQVFVGPVPSKKVADRLNALVKTKFSLQGLIVRYRE